MTNQTFQYGIKAENLLEMKNKYIYSNKCYVESFMVPDDVI